MNVSASSHDSILVAGTEPFSLPVLGGLVKFHLECSLSALTKLKADSVLPMPTTVHEGSKVNVLIAWNLAQHSKLGTPFAECAAW